MPLQMSSDNKNDNTDTSLDLGIVTERLRLLELENRQLRHRVEVLERAEDLRRNEPQNATERARGRANHRTRPPKNKQFNNEEGRVPCKYRDKHSPQIDIRDSVYLATKG